MNHFAKTALAVTSVGFLAVASATPSAARDWSPWAAAGAGFAAGAVVGAAATNSYHGPYGYYGSSYYGPGYAYAPAPTVHTRTVYRTAPAYNAYAYAGAPAVAAAGSCWRVTDSHRGYGFWGRCDAPKLTVTAREKARGGSD